MKLTELECRNCGAGLTESDVSERLAVVKCTHCGAMYALESTVPEARPATPPEGAAWYDNGQRYDVPMPKGFTVDDFGGRLTIARSWFSWAVIPMIFFAVFWNGFMIVWHTIALTSGAWFMSAFGLIHTAVGVGLTYFIIASFVNTTRVSADGESVRVAHGPLPWPGNKELFAHDIEQLFVKEKVSHGKHGASFSYEVHAILTSGTSEKFLTGLKEAEQALFIEQQLEKYLDIQDRAVRGEVAR